jgi:CubicO group peptidase (beta-lactamase class C family)
MKKIFLLLTIGIHACYLHAQQTYSPEIEAQIKQFENSLAGRVKIKGNETYSLEERMAHYKVKGLSIAVVQDYKVIWAKGYGWADENEKRLVTPETLFEPGSISKSLNAVGVLKLVQDKKLDLHTDINSYLTSWKFPYDSISNGKMITLAQLLSHSAGLSVHGFPGYDLMAEIPTVPQVLNGEPPANTSAVRSMFEPGTKFQYSGGGTTISQLIITDVTHQSYDAFMYENVLKPIGMIHSSYAQPPPEAKRKWCASGYRADGSPVPHKFHVYPEQGAAGLWMTPSDLCEYIIETQLAYEGKSAKVLNQEMTKLRLTPYNDMSAALGVFIDNFNGNLYFQHSAGNDGFCGQYYGSLEAGKGVAVFLNSEAYAFLPEIINSVATVYDWKGFYEPLHKKVVKVSDKILQKYIGVYVVEKDRFTNIVKKDDGYYLYADGTFSKMHFTNKADFFNMEFSTEKHFIKDASGKVTGYLRTADGKELPSAVKVLNRDTLQGNAEFFNAIGWSFLENRNYTEAIQYCKRGLDLHPESLYIAGNLAHAYLFSGKYQAAMEIYSSHMGEALLPAFSWTDMINQDFIFFSNNGFDPKPMNSVFTELKIDVPDGFKN